MLTNAIMLYNADQLSSQNWEDLGRSGKNIDNVRRCEFADKVAKQQKQIANRDKKCIECEDHNVTLVQKLDRTCQFKANPFFFTCNP